MKNKPPVPRKKGKRDMTKYELIVHLAKNQRVKPEHIITMTPKELAAFVDDGCKDMMIRYVNKGRERMAKFDLAFPGLKGRMSKLALITGVDKYLKKHGMTRLDIFWPKRDKGYTRRNIVQVGADALEVRTALERLQTLVPQKTKRARKPKKG